MDGKQIKIDQGVIIIKNNTMLDLYPTLLPNIKEKTFYVLTLNYLNNHINTFKYICETSEKPDQEFLSLNYLKLLEKHYNFFEQDVELLKKHDYFNFTYRIWINNKNIFNLLNSNITLIFNMYFNLLKNYNCYIEKNKVDIFQEIDFDFLKMMIEHHFNKLICDDDQLNISKYYMYIAGNAKESLQLAKKINKKITEFF